MITGTRIPFPVLPFTQPHAACKISEHEVDETTKKVYSNQEHRNKVETAHDSPIAFTSALNFSLPIASVKLSAITSPVDM
jgi:hypothetical protein